MKAKRVLIFGAGGFGREILANIKKSCNVVGFLDNDENKWGLMVDDTPIVGGCDYVISNEHDEVILGTMAYNIVEQLVSIGEPRNKINTRYIDVRMNARSNFLRDFALLCRKQKQSDDTYCVAEGGCFQGEFSKEINEAFKECDLYLFDTFEGFDARDTNMDNERGLSNLPAGHFGFTNEDIVISACPYPEKVHIVKGYFPDSVDQVNSSNKYLFVNLDFDLYNPTLEGLKYFYPKMLEQGVILVHDYYHMNYKGVPKAIEEFEKIIGHKLIKLPIGDHCSMAIIKNDIAM